MEGECEGSILPYLKKMNPAFVRLNVNATDKREYILVDEKPTPHMVHITELTDLSTKHPIYLRVTSYSPRYNTKVATKISKNLEVPIIPSKNYIAISEFLQKARFRIAQLVGFKDFIDFVKEIEN